MLFITGDWAKPDNYYIPIICKTKKKTHRNKTNYKKLSLFFSFLPFFRSLDAVWRCLGDAQQYIQRFTFFLFLVDFRFYVVFFFLSFKSFRNKCVFCSNSINKKEPPSSIGAFPSPTPPTHSTKFLNQLNFSFILVVVAKICICVCVCLCVVCVNGCCLFYFSSKKCKWLLGVYFCMYVRVWINL